MMNTTEIYPVFLSELQNKLQVLDDKPEETAETCLKALWFKAAGINLSVEVAKSKQIMDLTDEQVSQLHLLIEKRISGIPVAHLTGRQNFMGLELLSDSRALIPRKETEILGYKSLEVCKHKLKITTHPNVLDVCCGSGNLGLALASLVPDLYIYSSDLSEDAVALTKENISFLHLENQVKAFQGNLFEAYKNENILGHIDVIVCNPPYISSAKVTKMNSEIANNEPTMAFDGGMLGTRIIQQLIRESPEYLLKGGSLVFEVGLGQGLFIMQLCEKSGRYSKIEAVNDHLDNIRVIHCIC